MIDLLRAFEILNVEPGCDAAELRKAWRALVRTYHPDMAKSDPKSANARLAEINAAWDLVCSCSVEDINRAKRMIAQRRLAAERRHRSEQERQRRARAAAVAAAKERAAADAGGAEEEEENRAHAHARTSADQAASREANMSAQTNAGAQEQIVSLARRAFQAAQVACSGDLRCTARSLYV